MYKQKAKDTVIILAGVIFCILFHTSIVTGQVKGDTFKVFYLGGQSNMDGYGYNHDLPDSLNKTFDDVWIYHGNSVKDDTAGGGLGKWSKLRPGHGVGFASDGKKNTYSDRFGLELSFAHHIKQKYPGENIALIKYSRGGSSIDSLAAEDFGSWEPDYSGKNQFDYFLQTVRGAMLQPDINNDGKPDKLNPAGILWMQGESDAAHTKAIAARYGHHLKRVMDLMRATFRDNDLPVVISKISDSWNDTDGKVWNFGDLVQHAQEQYVRSDNHAAIVRSTRYYKYSDKWHYDSNGYIDLGKEFAQEVSKIVQ